MTATPTGSRPPSERGTVVELLDEVRQLTAEVREQRKLWHPMAGGLWWDELPQTDWQGKLMNWEQGFGGAGNTNILLPNRHHHGLYQLESVQYNDRIEITIKDHTGWRLWQRAVFYGRKPPS